MGQIITKVNWIGTGSGLNPVLGNTSFTVSGEGNRILLVDCGGTVPLALISSGKIGSITDVLVTHPHGDHFYGLEGFGFFDYFALKRRGNDRPRLYLPTSEFARNLWENCLKGSMEKIQDETGNQVIATLETFFNVIIGKNLQIVGLPEATFFETLHVKTMENYGVKFENGIYYSGDTVELPKPDNDTKIIFQDCQFFRSGPADVHISYDQLKEELDPAVKLITHLGHLGGGYDKKDPVADGFAGFVMPGQEFIIA